MVQFYAYYNYGGYKDFYLGDDHSTQISLYYLPLLGVYEASLRESHDPDMETQVMKLKELPPIKALSDQTVEYNYPTQARTMVSHGGYKLMLRADRNDRAILSVRDIAGTKDPEGRSAPFCFMFVANTENDADKLVVAAAYLKEHLSDFEAFVATSFVNDFDVNGLRFDLGRFNVQFQKMASYTETELPANAYKKRIPLLILPNGFDLKIALAEQQIAKSDLHLVYDINGKELYRYSPMEDWSPYGSPYTSYGSYYPPQTAPESRNEKSKEKETRPSAKPQTHHTRSAILEKLSLANKGDTDSLKEALSELVKKVNDLETRIEALEKQNDPINQQ